MAQNGAVVNKQQRELAAARAQDQALEEHEYEAKASAKVSQKAQFYAPADPYRRV